VIILPYLRYVLRTSYVGRTEREPHNIAALGGYQAVQPTITHKLDNRLITNPNHGITPSVDCPCYACNRPMAHYLILSYFVKWDNCY
jgi:hypothetical protein